MKRYVAIIAIGVAAALPMFGAPSATATSGPVATASCTNARTPGGVKCLGPGEFCSHKTGYAAAYRRAGYRCNRKGRLEYR